MKLEYLCITGYQGIETLEIENPNPVIVFSGPNACGKSSVRDAIQFALDGVSGRCKLKKNYGDWLVNDSTEKKDSIITMRLGGIDYQRKVATGACTTDDAPDSPLLLPYLIGTNELSASDQKTVQKLCLVASSVKMSHEGIRDRLEDLGGGIDYIRTIMPYLRGGFAAGLKEAKNQCSLVRGEWKGITGENYGAAKAEDWKPEPIDVQARMDEIKVEVIKLEEARDALIEKRDSCPHEEVASGADISGYMDIGACPGCNADLIKIVGGREMYVKGTEPPMADPAKPKKIVETYESIGRLVGFADQAVGKELGKIQQVKREAGLLDEKADVAFQVHLRFKEWEKMCELLAPTGLPQELITEALTPINDRLAETMEKTGWPVFIRTDLSVTYGKRLFPLCSESEQWRVNVAIAEALSHVSGVKIFAIDRMDILEPKTRGVFIRWIDSVMGDHDTILVMATLKTEPKVPYGFTSVWLGG